MQQNTRSDKEVLVPGASRLGKRRLKSSGVSTSHLWEIVWTSFSSTWVERYNDCCKRRKSVVYWVRRTLKSASSFSVRSLFSRYSFFLTYNPFTFLMTSPYPMANTIRSWSELNLKSYCSPRRRDEENKINTRIYKFLLTPKALGDIFG